MSSLKEAESAGDSEQRDLGAAVMEVETRSDIPVSWAEKAEYGGFAMTRSPTGKELGRSVVGQTPAADP